MSDQQNEAEPPAQRTGRALRLLRALRSPEFWRGVPRRGWKVINSNFGVALFSIVLFGGATSIIATDQQVKRERATAQVELVRILAELQHRTWKLDLLCSNAPAGAALASQAGTLNAAIGLVLNGATASDPIFKDVHMAALVSRFEMQSGISHDGKAYESIRTLEQTADPVNADIAAALTVVAPYIRNRAHGLQEGWLPLKVRSFDDRPWLLYAPLPNGYRCGAEKF